MKKFQKILLFILLFSIISCSNYNKKYEIADKENIIYLKTKEAFVYNAALQIYDYSRRMLYFRLPVLNYDSGDFYIDDSIFSRFDSALDELSEDYDVNLHNLIHAFILYITDQDNFSYNSIRDSMRIIEEMDNFKKIKNNLVKPDYLVPYYLIKVMYTHVLISSIGNQYTLEQQKIIDSELAEYLTLIQKESKEHPWYTKMKLVDKLFNTHMIDYVDIVRELAIEADKSEYGARRPVWIFKGTELEKEYNNLNLTSQDEYDEKIYNLDYTSDGSLLEDILKLMDQEAHDYEYLKEKIQK